MEWQVTLSVRGADGGSHVYLGVDASEHPRVSQAMSAVIGGR